MKETNVFLWHYKKQIQSIECKNIWHLSSGHRVISSRKNKIYLDFFRFIYYINIGPILLYFVAAGG